MKRRTTVVLPGALAVVLVGCQQSAVQTTGGPTGATGEKQDIKKVAVTLQAKTVALIEAINAKNDARITGAKTELSKEADRAEDAIKSETGQVANQVNSAIGHIRAGVLQNNIERLERAKGLLLQASQA